ncbi:MAG TPA: hypothetical protein VGD46_15700, partial [Rhizobacter sp.]
MRTLTTHEDTAELPIELEGPYGLAVDATLLVKFKYHGPVKGATDGPGGPPIEPDTDESIEILGVSLKFAAPDGKGFFTVPIATDDVDEAELEPRLLEY